MKYSDFDLVRGIKSGDKSALDLLIHRWYPRIYGYVFKLIGHEQDSYDVTQDIFIAMMQNIKNYYPWKKFDSWLFTIAHNKCMDFFRMQQRVGQPENADIDLPDAAPLLDETVVVSVTIKNALTKLSAPQREVVLLHQQRPIWKICICTTLESDANSEPYPIENHNLSDSLTILI